MIGDGAEVLDYYQPGATQSTHDRVYLGLLGAWTFFTALEWVVLAVIWLLVNHGSNQNPKWILGVLLMAYGAYLLLAMATLIARLWFERPRQVITMSFNIVCLAFFPLGTALGIYGLWRLDTSP
jgi:hypothetical protein